MKLSCIVVLCVAAMLPAQNPPAKSDKPEAARPVAGQSAQEYANLEELQRDFQARKLLALDAYVSAHAKAADVEEALVEAAHLAQELARHEVTLRLCDRHLADHKDSENAGRMRMLRAGALRASGDAPGAEKAFREVMDSAGDDFRQFADAAFGIADILTAAGKKDQAMELLKTSSEAHPRVRGFKEHFLAKIGSLAKIGTEPAAIGKKDTADKPIEWADYKGKVVLLDFWATWCGPCVAEMPNVLAAYAKYHDKGFEVIGISLDQDRGAMDKFIAARKVPWRQYFDGKGWQNEVSVAWGIESIPATYLIGRDGKIAAVNVTGDALGSEIARLLADKGSPVPDKPK